MSKAHRFNKRQQKLARMHPAVYDAMAMLVGPLVWDDDFEAIRMPLLRLIRAEARTGLHLRDLEALCRAIADEGEIK
jgi:hypothetical protein